VTYEPVHVADLTAPRAWVFRSEGRSGPLKLADLLAPGDRTMTLPMLFFVVRHPVRGVVLIDTGLHPDAATSLSRDYGRLAAKMFGSLRPAAQAFPEQLAQAGVDREAVETVVMTHLHADHTSGMRLLPAATLVVSEREWAAATGRGAALNGYVSRHLPAPERVRRIDFEAEGEPHEPFAATVDLFGDGSIRLVSTPGHTPGHLSVLLQLADEQALVIGDAVYTLRNLREEILPMRTAHDGDYLESLRQISAFADRHPSARLIPTHDETAWRGAGA
jgi:glyoxylase-like metal-dependent hydrolase (beta-lactamase superfamily II)